MREGLEYVTAIPVLRCDPMVCFGMCIRAVTWRSDARPNAARGIVPPVQGEPLRRNLVLAPERRLSKLAHRTGNETGQWPSAGQCPHLGVRRVSELPWYVDATLAENRIRRLPASNAAFRASSHREGSTEWRANSSNASSRSYVPISFPGRTAALMARTTRFASSAELPTTTIGRRCSGPAAWRDRKTRRSISRRANGRRTDPTRDRLRLRKAAGIGTRRCGRPRHSGRGMS